MKTIAIRMAFGIIAFSFVLIYFWEFIGEPMLEGVSIFDHAEDNSDKWEYVITSMTLVSIAILIPLYYATKAEKQRDLAGDELDKIFNLSPDMICSGTVDGNFIRVNRSFTTILGYSEEELLGKPFFEYIHPDDRAKTLESIKMTFTTKGANLIENRYLCKNGSIKWISWSTQVLPEEGNFFGVGRDITRWKMAERDLLVKNYAIDSSTNAIAMADPTGKITYVNDKLVDMLGYGSKDELIGEESEIIRADDGLQKAVQKILLDRGEWSGEMVTARKDGSTFNAQVYSNTVRDDDLEMVCMMASIVDITDKKKYEGDLLIAKTRAEEAKSEKERYISLIAQDLKTPFTSLVVLLQLVMNDSEVSLPPAYMERFKSMLGEIDTAVNLINEVIHASHLQTGQIKLKKSFFDGNEIAFQVAANFGHLAEEKGVRLVNKVHERTRLYGDPVLYAEILGNIVSNAIKFSNKGDLVTMFVLNNEPTTIAVNDSGTGISEALEKDIFRHDIRTSKVGTAGERGIGFGLPLSRDIIEAHGGSLKFESSPGRGTVFYIGLPQVVPEVIVVDNNEIVGNEIKKSLRRLNVNVRLAWGGTEAFTAIKNKSPHLIICDSSLSDTDYSQFISTLRKEPKTANIPLLVMDSGENADMNEKIKEIEPNGIIRKPVQEENLTRQVLEYVV